MVPPQAQHYYTTDFLEHVFYFEKVNKIKGKEVKISLDRFLRS